MSLFVAFLSVFLLSAPAHALDWPTFTIPNLIQSADGSLRVAYSPIVLAPGESLQKPQESVTISPDTMDVPPGANDGYPREYIVQVRRAEQALLALALGQAFGFALERVNDATWLASEPSRPAATGSATETATATDLTYPPVGATARPYVMASGIPAIEYTWPVPVHTEPRAYPWRWPTDHLLADRKCGWPGDIRCRIYWRVLGGLPPQFREEAGAACVAYFANASQCPFVKALRVAQVLESYRGWAEPLSGNVYTSPSCWQNYCGVGISPERFRLILDALVY